MNYQQEIISEAWDEAQTLIHNNHDETGSFDKEMFKPKLETYTDMQSRNVMRLFTIRDNGKLVGYAIFLVINHLHYTDNLFAYQDVMFIDKNYRGLGAYKFMTWVDQELAKMGVHTVMRSVHVKKDYSRLLERMGYEKLETVFARRVN